MPEILQDINWLDIFFVILLLGMIYKGSTTGVGGQTISLIGWFVLIFAAIGYYSFLSEALFGFLLQDWARPASFFLISAIMFVVIKVLERVFNVIRGEELASIERIGGALVGAFRACIFFGIIGILLLLIPVEDVRLYVAEKSKTCMIFVQMDAQIYSWMTEFIGESEKKEKDEVIEEIMNPPERQYRRKE
ncbi:MAG: CvpA family protein [Candidatus Omnitrophota bacterium]